VSVDVVATVDQATAAAQAPLIVLEALEPYVPGEGPIEVARLGDGHSNETFRVRRAGRDWVLRRPPRPPFSAAAHDILREYAVVEALVELGAPAPRPLLACADLAPLGAPFYLMELVDGVMIRDRLPAAYDDSAGLRRVTEGMVDGLAAIHALPWEGTALATIGRPSGYLDRQLRRWQGQWAENATRPLAAIGEVEGWLLANRPGESRTTVVHGDYKLDNLLFDRVGPRLLAVVDWEMATLGDPLADLGFLLATYVGPGEEPDPVLGFSPATAAGGALTRAEIVDRYADRTGAEVAAGAWYECLALWKLAILFEGSYKRFLLGSTADPFFALLEDGVPRIAARALALAEGRR
jgi:aminoglycoside phosphotransferase (APT) family kinase protein